ncbi:hypothetical protein SCALM49S_06526 [Streptomyces californicus]
MPVDEEVGQFGGGAGEDLGVRDEFGPGQLVQAGLAPGGGARFVVEEDDEVRERAQGPLAHVPAGAFHRLGHLREDRHRAARPCGVMATTSELRAANS